MSIRILVVDDHQIFREGLRTLLAGDRDFKFVGEAKSGRAAVALCKEENPDVVVMDIAMPELNGVDATRQIIAACPTTKIVVLSAHIDRRLAAEVIAAGATGLVPKEDAFEELSRAIRAIVQGKIYLSPQLAGETVAYLTDPSSKQLNGVFKVLSGREREVLQLIAEGKPTKRIALQLDLSVKTVETHRRRLMAKLGLDNVAELTRYAVREGLATL